MKFRRQSKIIELINNYDIETQDELLESLRKNGFHVTQATISRDIRELKLTKTVKQDGKQKYVILTPSDNYISEKMIRVLKDGVISMDYAQNILVIKTLTGMAMAVAAAIDSLNNIDILGTIAGDDTIFCVVKNEDKALKLMENLRNVD